MIDFEFEFQYSEESTPTLRKVSGSIPAGRCVVLCGGSGCGKSTLLRCINGLIPQFYEGELKGFCRLAGKDTDGLSIGEIGKLAASVFQDPRSQFFTVNSANEVAFGLENHGLPQEKIRQRVDEAFQTFHLEHLKDRNVYELSNGERQLISILSAWAMDTDIFLLDEPTANLDFAATRQLKTILLALKKQGKIVAVIFRFFPVLSGDMKLLRQSIRTRGAFVTLGQKLRALPSYIEILTVPMALRVIRIAETLSASAETRGIDLRLRKSNYISLHLSAWDIIFCALLAAAVAAGIIL